MTTKKQISTENIQAALRKTKASKKSTAPEGQETQPATSGESVEASANKRPRLTEEERSAREETKKQEREAKRAERDQVRAQKKAAREAERSSKTAHMAKVEKAAQNLPTLAKGAQSLVNDVMQRFDESAITSIIAHLSHQLRAKSTERALNVQLKEGELVRIVSADGSNSRWIGTLAHVLTAQRIRCYVQPVGTEKKVYLFSSNVKPLTDDEIKAYSSATSQRPTAKAS